ncbi:NmrA family NAD(P)-binding protein [Algibacter sp. TI.3.09]|uniref:SDR family oxidoreductase n=1 Tax=Algibacter sp. TI.3.09 TaxID=3121298 RepID=UPI00311DAE8A
MKVFVLGAAGFQGSNIAQELIIKGHDIVTLKRSEGNVVMPSINVVKGGLESEEALNKALTGVDAAVYTFPLLFDLNLAKAYTSNFIKAAKAQKVAHVVFNVGFDLQEKSEGFLALDIKAQIKKLLDASGLNVTTLVPDIYIDNISAPWSIPVILNNNIVPYPVASGSKVPWISHLDLGKYVASAIEKPELSGRVLPIGGNLFSGEEIAAAISIETGKELHYVSVTPDEFEEKLSPAFGEIAGREISNLYRYVKNNREQMIAKDYKGTQELLGVTPQSLSDWVKSVKWELKA